jgi:hypothetical protein
VCRLLVAACVVPGSPVLVALVGGGVGSCGGRAARRPEDAVLLCYISFLTSFSFFSVVFYVVFIFDVYVICILFVICFICVLCFICVSFCSATATG